MFPRSANVLFAALFISFSLAVSNAANAFNMPQYGKAPTPVGYLMYCLKAKEDCKRRTKEFAPERALTLIKNVQLSVNRNIRPVSDDRNYRKTDYWTIAKNGHGDCEDYALTKRNLLIKAGLPASSLLLASAVTEQGEPHMVLVVRTQGQDYVLDNRFDTVKEWQYLPYKWVSIQDMKNPMKWKKPDALKMVQLQRTIR